MGERAVHNADIQPLQSAAQAFILFISRLAEGRKLSCTGNHSVVT